MDAIKDMEIMDEKIFKFYNDGVASVEDSFPSFNPLQISPQFLQSIYLETRKRFTDVPLDGGSAGQ